MVADLHSQGSADNDIKLLTGMSCEGNIIAALIRIASDEKRFTNLIFKCCRKIIIFHAVGVVDLKTLAASCDRVRCENGTFTLDNIIDINIESNCASVQEGKREILLAAFAGNIILDSHVGLFRHFGRSKSHDLTKLLDSPSHFVDLEIQACHFFHL